MTPKSFEESAVAAAKRHFESKNVSKKIPKTVSKKVVQHVPLNGLLGGSTKAPKMALLFQKV